MSGNKGTLLLKRSQLEIHWTDGRTEIVPLMEGITRIGRGKAGNEVAVPDVERESADLAWPLDVVVLGMGDDGHVASLFPGDESGFAAAGPSRFAAVRGPGDEPRISLTASAIARARSVYLLIRGSDKRAVLRAASGSDLPIARVLAARQGGLVVYASP